jgi:hypothetical protein
MFHWPNVSLTGCFTNWMFHRPDVLPTGCFTNWMFHQPDVSPTGCFTDEMFHWPDVSPTRCLTDQMFHRPDVSPTVCFTDRMFHWPDVSLTGCFTDRMFHQSDVLNIRCFTTHTYPLAFPRHQDWSIKASLLVGLKCDILSTKKWRYDISPTQHICPSKSLWHFTNPVWHVKTVMPHARLKWGITAVIMKFMWLGWVKCHDKLLWSWKSLLIL